ncbi:MAG: primosomal protein N' (replication factor Y) [Gammaproteobacteria bacterium]|jgi:primosomal protein N' (replication factor Y)
MVKVPAYLVPGGVVLSVAVPSPLRTLFDYLPPRNAPIPPPGARVRVPFGRGSKVAMVIAQSNTSCVEPKRLRAVSQVIDERPLFDESLLSLVRFSIDYFHHAPGEVLATMLPAWLREGGDLSLPVHHEWALTERAESALAHGMHFGAVQRKVLDILQRERVMVDPPSNLRDALARLLVRQLVSCASVSQISSSTDALRVGLQGPSMLRAADRDSQSEQHAPATIAAPPLNTHQQAVVDEIAPQLNRFATYLLDGVTGSGKTEVYLALITQVLAVGRQALVLIPEIGLTPQIVQRFRERLGVPIAVMHSAMAEGERRAAWLAARSGAAPVVVGTRSAVFTPLARPGIVIVDEEHDLSYKQQDGLRYSARDLAILRARHAQVPVVLGSASPSLESLHNVRSQRYQLVSLPQRAAAGHPPTVRVVDLRARALREGLSEPVHDALQACLRAGEQAILFVNRRGYAPVMMCHVCGAPVDCSRCDAHMVLHQQDRLLRCHHCDRTQAVPSVCACGANGGMYPVGAGTQRVADHVALRFPAARVARVDRDSTRRRGAMSTLIGQVHRGEIDVLVGTQMLAKGHDFPNVTLVAILDADGGLFSADFRAGERMAQLLTQVRGRAGRASRAGTVLIQTHHPQHPLLRTLVTAGYRAFAEVALAERQASALPPFAYLALLRAEAPTRERTLDFLEQVRRIAPKTRGVAVLGPVPAPMERRAGRMRGQLLLEASGRASLHHCLRQWIPLIEALPEARRVRWSLDVDPQEMM